MTEPSLGYTLRHHMEQLAAETSHVQPIVPHSCEYCARLLVKLPDVYPPHNAGLQEPVSAPITGLNSSEIHDAAQNGCLLFEQWLKSFEDEFLVRELEQGGLHLNMLFDYRGDHRLDWIHAPEPAWTAALFGNHPDSGNGFRQWGMLSKVYTLGIADGSSVPLWLQENRTWRSSAATEEAFESMRGWLGECLLSSLEQLQGIRNINVHKSCGPVPNSFMPSRLVHIADLDATSIEIVETGDLGYDYVPWCSLSYCWGGPQELQTTSKNFQCGRRTIPISELPQTITDAALVVKMLGASYLWVDSLCILQDDPEDLQKELVDMVKVYKHSIVTLAASSASAVSEGFLKPRNLAKNWITPPIQLRCQNESGASGHILLHDIKDDEEADPLDLRGWALQEKLLSQRMLVFGTRTLRWVCLSHSYRDSGLQYPESVSVGYVSRGAALFRYLKDPWDIVIEQYTARRLTYEDNKLIALAAIAEEYDSRCFDGWNYLAGLWRPTLSSMLFWCWKKSSGNRRSKVYRAPSWSWASINSNHPVWFPKECLVSGIIKTEIVPRSFTMPYGDAESGFMLIECKIACFFLKRDKESRPYLTRKEDDQKNLFEKTWEHFPYGVVLDAREDDFMGWNSPGKIVYRVWVLLDDTPYGSKKWGLLLKKVRGTTDTYVRVGVCKVSRFWDDFLADFERTKPRTIIIQ